MPALFAATAVLDAMVKRNASSANATADPLQVICAWPVSGQYGPGSRALYYVLIATCVFARKAEWLRNACLAAALLFPAVAALHAIVLAALRIDGAVDMDVFGAFQLCSIGILAAPVTVRLSRTYFYDPGRNTIFVWTLLILAGLLSLTVEFFRIHTTDCPFDDAGNPLPNDPNKFPDGTMCNITCTVNDPISPMRGGSANNIYVIPAPSRLTFGTATLLAAACCIPAILSLMSMWNKILEINWKSRFGNVGNDERNDEVIEGTNGATLEKMKGVNSLISIFLSAVEVPVFGAAVLAILIIGELNFFSHQVRYQSEPIACIGQWAPIVGTGIAVLGSLLLNTGHGPGKGKGTPNNEPNGPNGPNGPKGCIHHCDCQKQEVMYATSTHSLTTPGADEMHPRSPRGARGSSTDLGPTASRPAATPGLAEPEAEAGDAGNRLRVAHILTSVSNYLGTAAFDRFDYSDFKHGKAVDFPEIPGEDYRNRKLIRIRKRYNQFRDANGNVTPALHRQSSRPGSFTGSFASGTGPDGGVEGSSTAPLATSPRRPSTSVLPPEQGPLELQNIPSSSSAAALGGGILERRDTLQVPPASYHSPSRNNSNQSTSLITSVGTAREDKSSPTIVVSPDPGAPVP